MTHTGNGTDEGTGEGADGGARGDPGGDLGDGPASEPRGGAVSDATGGVAKGAVNGAVNGGVNGADPDADRGADGTDGIDGADSAVGTDGAVGGRGRKRGGWRESVLLIAGGVVVALLLRMFVIGTFWIPSESMENTLIENDRVLVNRLSGSPGRGDVVVFKGWDGTDWIKRVIAVGGDTVKCCDSRHRLSVNGVPLDEDYLYPGDYASGDSFEVKVPKGRLWVMGDHRVASRDSRSFRDDEFGGTIGEDVVLGRAWAVYWPPSRARLLSTPPVFEKTR